MRIIALLVAFATFSCTSNAKNNRFSKALSTTLLATDGSQVSFKNILKNTKEKLWLLKFGLLGADCVKAMQNLRIYNEQP
jgi:hypothetical protein